MQHISPKVNKFLFPFLSDPGKPGLYNIFLLICNLHQNIYPDIFSDAIYQCKVSLSLRFLEPSITFMNSTPVVKTEGGGNFCLFILLKKVYFFSGGPLVEIGFCQYWTILDWPEALDSKIQSGENGSIKEITLKCNGVWGQYNSAVEIDEEDDGENICDEDWRLSNSSWWGWWYIYNGGVYVCMTRDFVVSPGYTGCFFTLGLP